jgi:hypothetical protein
MKLLITSLALGMTIASPAFAQTAKHVPAEHAHAQAGRTTQAPVQRHSPNPEWDVYGAGGVYIGSDPDPLVRLDLITKPFQSHGFSH